MMLFTQGICHFISIGRDIEKINITFRISKEWGRQIIELQSSLGWKILDKPINPGFQKRKGFTLGIKVKLEIDWPLVRPKPCFKSEWCQTGLS